MGAYDRDLPMLNPRKVARGKYGKLYTPEGDYMDDVTEFEAIIKFNKKEIARGNAFMSGHRIMGGKGEGKIKIYLTNAAFKKKIAEDPDAVYTYIGTVDEVDGQTLDANYEVAIKGISFDEVPVHMFKVDDIIEYDLPFTFDNFEPLS